MSLRLAAWAALAAALTMVVSACSNGGSDARSAVVISAAASLTDVFTSMETAFEKEYPQFDALFNFSGSAALREQILEGAPADVFVSANSEIMDEVAGAGEVVGLPDVFATNHMVIAVPTGNPGAVTGLDDLAREDLFVGLCADAVPCGTFARQVLASAGVDPSIDTNESNVRSLLFKIGLGEIDIGIVYATDVMSVASAVDPITVPLAHDVTARYTIALLTGAPNSAGGDAFIRFVFSDEGAAVLETHGFGIP